MINCFYFVYIIITRIQGCQLGFVLNLEKSKNLLKFVQVMIPNNNFSTCNVENCRQTHQKKNFFLARKR